MQDREPSLIARDDTFFGVCQALGEDFGFNPLYLRVAFGVPLMFSPLVVLAAYFGLGAIVLISRLLAPRPRRKAAPQPIEANPDLVPALIAEADADQYALPMAA
jgi:phage shock protein PspC (stress-responsive transcriptional regulator)